MSDSASNKSDKLNTRYSTPAPELDDHRSRNLTAPSSAQAPPVPRSPAPRSPVIPSLEIQQPTPRPSVVQPSNLARIDEALRNANHSGGPVTSRDFEVAIDDAEHGGDEWDNPPGTGRKGSIKPRRFTDRAGRPSNIVRNDRSRDNSSSRSSSPANSIEAFAEPRRRQRANTVESRTSSPDYQRRRRLSHGTARRGTLSNVSVPADITQRTDRDALSDAGFEPDEEPGKTLKIDYEELEEFVALCAQGKIPDEVTTHSESGSTDASPKIYEHFRRNNDEVPNIALNAETFFEKTLTKTSTNQSKVTKKPDSKPKHDEWKDVERFTFFSPENPSCKRATKLGGLLSDGTTFRDLFDLGPDEGPWWLDVLNPTKAELEAIGKAFKIHRLTREDIETQEAREKVELFAQYYFVCFRSFIMDKHSEDFLDPIHLYIIVCGDGVLSFSYTRNPHAKNVRKRIAKLGDFVSLSPDYVCYAMIDDIVDCFAPIIHDAELESEYIEDQVFIAREDDLSALLKSIGYCRKRVLNMMRLLGGKADVIKGFAKRCNESYEMTPRGDIGLYLGDIQDHVVTMMSNLGHVEKMLSRSHANYLAQLNVDNLLKGNQSNKALTKITVVATILVPLNLITGLFGMNVTIPGQDTGHLYWFFGILGTIVLFVCTCLAIAKRSRYI